MGLVCRNLVAAWIPYPGSGLYVRTGADFPERGLAAILAAVCSGWTDGTDELSAAIGVVHLVLLSLHDRTVWADWASDGVGSDGHSFWGPDCGQQLVVKAILLRPDGVVVARHDVWKVPVDAERGSGTGGRSGGVAVANALRKGTADPSPRQNHGDSG